jgi:hypothetical protein
MAYAFAASVSAASLGRLLEVVDALDGLRGSAHNGQPMADIQTLAGSLVLERALKLGLDCSNDPAFLSFDAKRRGDHQRLKLAA